MQPPAAAAAAGAEHPRGRREGPRRAFSRAFARALRSPSLSLCRAAPPLARPWLDAAPRRWDCALYSADVDVHSHHSQPTPKALFGRKASYLFAASFPKVENRMRRAN